MSRNRRSGEVPSLVTTAIGTLVATICAVFGIGAHGLATGMDLARLDAGQALLAMGVSAAIGATVAELARRWSPLLLAGGALLAGPVLIHLVLSIGHGHHGGAMRTPVGITEHASVGAAHVQSLLTPTMLSAHLAAIALTVVLVALLIAVLDWGAARMPPLPTRAPAIGIRVLGGHRTDQDPDGRYLLSAGGTRATETRKHSDPALQQGESLHRWVQRSRSTLH